MSLFATPEAHAANPPESWTVERIAGNGARAKFGLVIEPGAGPAETFGTRQDAERAKNNPQSWLRSLYEKERRWYAGENIAGWRPWAEIAAEREQKARAAA